MKAILNLLKGLAVIYWVLAASLFVSMLFFPQAIDTLHTAYNGIAGGNPTSEVSSSESASSEITESSIEESSSEVSESSSEELVSSSEEPSSSEEIISSSEEPSSSEETSQDSSLPESQPLRQANGEVCTLQCIDDPATEEFECLSACDFSVEWIGYDIPTDAAADPVHGDMYIVIDSNDDLFYSVFVFVVSTDLNEAGEEIVVSEWVEVIVPIGQTEGYDFYYDVELGQIFILELVETGGPGPLPEEEIVIGELTREEFVVALEEILIYSAIFMLPLTILVFSLGGKFNEATSEIEPVEIVTEEQKQSKKLAAKTRAIGVTRLRVRK
jgi:hypothetical protein